MGEVEGLTTVTRKETGRLEDNGPDDGVYEVVLPTNE